MEEKRSGGLSSILSSLVQLYFAHVISSGFSRLSNLKKEVIISVIAILFTSFLLMVAWVVVVWTMFVYLLMHKFNYLEAGVTIALLNLLLSFLVFFMLTRRHKE